MIGYTIEIMLGLFLLVLALVVFSTLANSKKFARFINRLFNHNESIDIEAQTAELKKKATISEAEARQKAIELGGGISERDRVLAEIAAKRDIGVAEALKGVNVPTTVVGGTSGGNGGGDLLNMALLKYMGVLPTTPPAK